LAQAAAGNQQLAPVAAKKQAWVDAHYEDAKAVADKYGVTPEEILGIAALESDWGNSRFAKKGNYFGLHAPVQGQTGSVKIENGPGYAATFNNFRESAEAFMRTKGRLVVGVKDPTEFARILQDKGKFGINIETGKNVPGYVESVAGTIRGLGAYKPRRR